MAPPSSLLSAASLAQASLLLPSFCLAEPQKSFPQRLGCLSGIPAVPRTCYLSLSISRKQASCHRTLQFLCPTGSERLLWSDQLWDSP